MIRPFFTRSAMNLAVAALVDDKVHNRSLPLKKHPTTQDTQVSACGDPLNPTTQPTPARPRFSKPQPRTHPDTAPHPEYPPDSPRNSMTHLPLPPTSHNPRISTFRGLTRRGERMVFGFTAVLFPVVRSCQDRGLCGGVVSGGGEVGCRYAYSP